MAAVSYTHLQFVKLGDKIVAIPMISKEQQNQEATEQKDFEMNADTSGLTVAGHIGTCLLYTSWFCPNASDSELLHMVTKHPDMFDRLIEWENEDNIFHRRMTRRETPVSYTHLDVYKRQHGD